MRRSLGSTILACAVALATVAGAAPSSRKAPPPPSKSVGAPNKGHLDNGVRVEPTPYLRILGAYAAGDVRYGTRELTDAIDRAAREVHRRYPDAQLGVGQLSKKGGGNIERHHSHESGRDADLGFYLVDVLGRPVLRDSFHSIRENGVATSDPSVRFDDGRNWTLVAALASDPHAHVTHIFVATHLRTRLLAYGAKIGAAPAVRQRVADLLMQPKHALPHDDHFHVRVACPGNSPECVEFPVVLQPKRAKAVAKPQKTPKTPSTHVEPEGAEVAKASPKAQPSLRKITRARSTGKVKPEPIAVTPAQDDDAPYP
jgi:penicillin-insensitive murein endopeptidase